MISVQKTVMIGDEGSNLSLSLCLVLCLTLEVYESDGVMNRRNS